MVALYRCRTSLREVAQAFDAQPPQRADWSAEIWPGRTGLVVRSEEGRRVISAMNWGVARTGAMGSPPGSRSATTIWFRELWNNHRPLLEPENRCLIVVEAFAKPETRDGATTRTWYGCDESPLLGWPGVWLGSRHRPGFCGILVAANAFLSPHGNMPVVLPPQSAAEWLSCDLRSGFLIARTPPQLAGMYREPTEEPWNGRQA